MPHNPADTLTKLKTALDGLEAGRLDLETFLAVWQDTDGLLAGLPPRFKEVLDGTLMRLESSRLFSGDSCSFSQKGLLENLRVWHDKAALRLAAATSPQDGNHR